MGAAAPNLKVFWCGQNYIVSRNPKWMFPVFQKHIHSRSKTKPYQNSIKWRCFPHDYHFCGRQSVPFYFLLLMEKMGFEWRIRGSYSEVCAVRLGSCAYTELEKSGIREEHSRLNMRRKFLASPDGIRVLKIMPDVASDVNFCVHLLISCQQVLRQGAQWPWWFPLPRYSSTHIAVHGVNIFIMFYLWPSLAAKYSLSPVSSFVSHALLLQRKYHWQNQCLTSLCLGSVYLCFHRLVSI